MACNRLAHPYWLSRRRLGGYSLPPTPGITKRTRLTHIWKLVTCRVCKMHWPRCPYCSRHNKQGIEGMRCCTTRRTPVPKRVPKVWCVLLETAWHAVRGGRPNKTFVRRCHWPDEPVELTSKTRIALRRPSCARCRYCAMHALGATAVNPEPKRLPRMFRTRPARDQDSSGLGNKNGVDTSSH